MLATAPSFAPALGAVQDFRSRHSATLAPDVARILDEVAHRLTRLERLVGDLISLNNDLLGRHGLSIEVDSTTDTIIIRAGGEEQRLTVKRADPNVPITARVVAAGSGYAAGSVDLPPEDADLRLELETKLEAVYQSAHRILKLVRKVPGLPTIRSTAVTRVRNNLIEHPADGALYSFGFDMNGPRVKPLASGPREFNDDGLVPNMATFIADLSAGFAAAGT